MFESAGICNDRVKLPAPRRYIAITSRLAVERIEVPYERSQCAIITLFVRVLSDGFEKRVSVCRTHPASSHLHGKTITLGVLLRAVFSQGSLGPGEANPASAGYTEYEEVTQCRRARFTSSTAD